MFKNMLLWWFLSILMRVSHYFGWLFDIRPDPDPHHWFLYNPKIKRSLAVNKFPNSIQFTLELTCSIKILFRFFPLTNSGYRIFKNLVFFLTKALNHVNIPLKGMLLRFSKFITLGLEIFTFCVQCNFTLHTQYFVRGPPPPPKFWKLLEQSL